MTDKESRRVILIAFIIAVIILLLLSTKRGRQILNVVTGGDLSVTTQDGGSIVYKGGDINIAPYSIPDFTTYDQQSSCGCSIMDQTKETVNSVTVMRPATVKNSGPNIVYLPPPPPVGGSSMVWNVVK